MNVHEAIARFKQPASEADVEVVAWFESLTPAGKLDAWQAFTPSAFDEAMICRAHRLLSHLVLALFTSVKYKGGKLLVVIPDDELREKLATATTDKHIEFLEKEDEK